MERSARQNATNFALSWFPFFVAASCSDPTNYSKKCFQRLCFVLLEWILQARRELWRGTQRVAARESNSSSPHFASSVVVKIMHAFSSTLSRARHVGSCGTKMSSKSVVCLRMDTIAKFVCCSLADEVVAALKPVSPHLFNSSFGLTNLDAEDC